MYKFRIVPLLMLFLSNISYAADNKFDKKQIYELKTLCGKSAFEYYERNKLCDGHGNYTSHYNVRLNSCFIYMMASCKADKDSEIFWAEDLIDVNENKVIATYLGDNKLIGKRPAMCMVEKKECKNLGEFKELIKPYMNE